MKITLLACLLFAIQLHAQTYTPALQDAAQVTTNRAVTPITYNGHQGIYIKEGDGGQLVRFNHIMFATGTVEFDVKGRNVIGASFVGLAFHVQNDSTYDAVYFRPFNFVNPDTVRRWRAVQYIAIPGHDWDVLRENFPGKYENKVSPVPNPDGWFHAKIVIDGSKVSVFVNNRASPCLMVHTLSGNTTGGIGLWVDNGSDGSFANVSIKGAE